MKKNKLNLADFNNYELTKKHSLTIKGGLTSGGILIEEEFLEDGEPEWGGPGNGTVSGTTSAT